MLIDNEEYPIKNPKYYLVILSKDGETIDELLFTREAILKYLKENERSE